MRRALTLLLIVAGAGLIAAAVVEGASTGVLVAEAEQTTGRVVAVESRQAGGSRSEVSLFPVVEYVPLQEGPKRFRGEGSGVRDYRVGDEVEVLYRARPARDERITGFGAVWSRTAGFLFAGVLFLLTGLLGRSMLADSGSDPEGEEP